MIQAPKVHTVCRPSLLVLRIVSMYGNLEFVGAFHCLINYLLHAVHSIFPPTRYKVFMVPPQEEYAAWFFFSK